jgi:hypothetical protein
MLCSFEVCINSPFPHLQVTASPVSVIMGNKLHVSHFECALNVLIYGKWALACHRLVVLTFA